MDLSNPAAQLAAASGTPSSSSTFISSFASRPSATLEPPEKVHPIQSIITELLDLFRAYYQVNTKEYDVRSDSKEEPHHDDPDDAEDSAYHRNRWSKAPATTLGQFVDPLLRAKAGMLETHDKFGSVLCHWFDVGNWPQADKQEDQLDPNYRKNAENLKRAHIDEEDEEDDDVPASKRQATGPSTSRI